MIEFRELAHGSAEYESTVGLRRQVLRWPLGLDFTSEDLAAEAAEIHLAGFDGERVVACLVLVPFCGGEVKMRQVAVSPGMQHRGIGRALVAFSEAFALGRGFSAMVLHARDTAVSFYLALGYELVGEPFEEVGIPHCAMRKPLAS